jgi:hypothetical protein
MIRKAAVADIKPTVKVYWTKAKCEPMVPSINRNTQRAVITLEILSSKAVKARSDTIYTHKN